MATKKDVIERLHFVTDRLSTQVRTLGLGILAVTWGIMVGDSPTARTMSTSLRIPLLLTATLAILALLLDFFQYVAGHRVAKSLLDTMERDKKDEGKFDDARLAYKLQSLLFSAKQWTLTFATLGLLATMSYYLIKH
jgi:hypothetical protein